MTIYAVWHGGANYSVPYVSDDVESFPNLRAAITALESRKGDGAYIKEQFNYVNRDRAYVFTPTVGNDSLMDIYLEDPTDSADPYPDYRLSFGPRGGIVKENC